MKFVLGAWNEGDFSDADNHIAPDMQIYTNGLSLSSEHDGPAIARQSIESWRELAPDLRMELSQEIREKHRIAIEFRITGTHTGDAPGTASHASGGAIGRRCGNTAFLERSAAARSQRSGRSSIRSPSCGPDGSRRGARLVAGAQLVPVLSAFACSLGETAKRARPCLDHLTPNFPTVPSLPVRVRAASRTPAREPRPGGSSPPPTTVRRHGATPSISAVLVTSGEDEELAGVLRRLHDSPAERAVLAERGLRRVSERFAWPAVAQATVERYQQAMAGMGRPGC